MTVRQKPQGSLHTEPFMSTRNDSLVQRTAIHPAGKHRGFWGEMSCMGEAEGDFVSPLDASRNSSPALCQR